MLTPGQSAALRDRAFQITDPINDYLLEDIARRISEAGQLTSTAAYQVWRMQQLGVSQQEIQKRLQKLLRASRQEIGQLLTQSAEVGYRFDISRLPSVQAVPFQQNTVLQQIVSAAVELAQEDFTNLTQTLGMVDPYGNAQPLQAAYRACTDFAFKQVVTGAADYSSAIRQATRNLAAQGVRVIDYESGVHTSLEAAVRRNIMGGLGLMQERISRANHDALGCDGWEITAHASSAPDHEPIQGRQYSDAAYEALNNSLVRRIGTLNCGHAAFPIILGVNSPQYTPKELEKLRADNEKGVTVDGKHYTGYEATQMQRKLERAIRGQKRRVMIDEAAGDNEKLVTDRIKLRQLNQKYEHFSKSAGLKTQYERTEAAQFETSRTARPANNEDERLLRIDQSRQERLIKNPELALPNVSNAIATAEKFTKYLFNPENTRGYAKGVAFTSRLGYDIDSWQELQDEIMRRAGLFPAKNIGNHGHGVQYEQKMILYGRTGRPTNVIVGWILEDDRPRMTTAYVKEVKQDDD